MRSLFATQQEIDRAYNEGKTAYFRDVGTHGPTFKTIQAARSRNPYRHVDLLLAWDRGYNQDVRRVVARQA